MATAPAAMAARTSISSVGEMRDRNGLIGQVLVACSEPPHTAGFV